jgi:hypothetical protein
VRTSRGRGSSSAGREIAFGRQLWAYVLLVVALSALTSPLWLVSPPLVFGTPDRFRIAALAFWLGITAIAFVAGRDWGATLRLDFSGRAVTRELRMPWGTRVLWSYSGDQVCLVALTKEDAGTVRVEALLREGSTLLIDRGFSEPDLHSLGRQLARCWHVPFRT